MVVLCVVLCVLLCAVWVLCCDPILLVSVACTVITKLARDIALSSVLQDNQCRTIRNGELVGTDEKSMRRKSVNTFLGSGAVNASPGRERVIDQFPSKSKESTVVGLT